MTFERELEELRPKLMQYAYGLCRNKTDVEDVVQEGMLKAYRDRATYIDGGNMLPWVKTIVRNTYFSLLRREVHRSDLCDPLGDRDIKVDEHQAFCVDLKKIAAQILMLPAEQQLVVRLVCIEGWSCGKAASMLDAPVSTVKSRLRLARKRLRELIGYD